MKTTKNTAFTAKLDGTVRHIELIYTTDFANGAEIEEFVFYINPDGKAVLAGYYLCAASASTQRC